MCWFEELTGVEMLSVDLVSHRVKPRIERGSIGRELKNWLKSSLFISLKTLNIIKRQTAVEEEADAADPVGSPCVHYKNGLLS